jgi:phosphatidate cytidylyltransferase
VNISNLQKRVFFALWATPLGWWLANSTFSLLPSAAGTLYPGQLAIMILVVIATLEYTRMMARIFPTNAFWLGTAWIIVDFALYLSHYDLPSSLKIYTLLIVIALEAVMWGKKDNQRRWKRVSLFFSGMMFLWIAGASLLNFYEAPFQSFFVNYSHPMLSQLGFVIVLASVFMCDTTAYFVGTFWGTHHFSSTSPNKTIEGSIGGFVAALSISTAGWLFFSKTEYHEGILIIIGIIMGILIGIFAQLGDLLVSLIKRYFRVKDSSDIIPGHGGILDRFDSLFFTAPILWLYFWIISKFLQLG